MNYGLGLVLGENMKITSTKEWANKPISSCKLLTAHVVLELTQNNSLQDA